MKTFLALAILVAVLAAGIGGCVKVDVPKGPYVDLGNGGGSQPTAAGNSINDVRALLKRARADGIITDNQYQILCDRAERELRK
ncbi:MAG TPA: hypothetical protein VFJ30_00785 [Phycisphaerae bacterium]|nr:hypothetical protein [Phycisphaerae bacterium]